MQRINKKGDLEFDLILKLVLVIIVLLIIIGLIFLFKNKSLSIIDSIKNLFRFGA